MKVLKKAGTSLGDPCLLEGLRQSGLGKGGLEGWTTVLPAEPVQWPRQEEGPHRQELERGVARTREPC